MSRRPNSALTWARRLVQLACLALFVYLVLWMRPDGSGTVSRGPMAFFYLDPLIAVTTWLTTHTFYTGALLALVTVVVTVLFGRVFCGWVCPLGTIHDVAGRALDIAQKPRPGRDRWSRWQLAKYYILAGGLSMALFGSVWIVAFDPLVLLYRSITTVGIPPVQWAVETGSKAIYDADPRVGLVWVSMGPPELPDVQTDGEALEGGEARPQGFELTRVSEPAYEWFRDKFRVTENQAFLGSGLLAGVFVGILAANAWRRRFWCRYLCPLGAFLGCLSWRPLLRRKVKAQECNQCDLCGMACHGAAAASPGSDWKPAECLGCLNCTASCNRQGLAFRWTLPWRRKEKGEKLDVSRRGMLAAAIGGLVTLAWFRSTPQARGSIYHPDLIRPPGSLPEKEFLARCLSCGMCMKVCPTGGLHPTIGQAGLEGLWTPRLVPRIGHCDYECTLCGQVCPTGAIELLTPEEKHEVKIGLAAFDTARCIPYAYGRGCMVCEEHCPVPTKAIYYVQVEVEVRDGRRVQLKQPRVDPDLCIGCGVCESVCPLKDRPGIRVFSANETRNPANQPILPGDDASGWDDPY